MASREYKDYLISVSAIHDTPSQFQFTPVVEVRCGDSTEVLTTILTQHAFILQEGAIEFGFILGREWIDKHLSEFPSSED